MPIAYVLYTGLSTTVSKNNLIRNIEVGFVTVGKMNFGIKFVEFDNKMGNVMRNISCGDIS